MKRFGAILIFAFFLTQCKSTETSDSKSIADTKQEALQRTTDDACFDSRRVRVRCDDSHALTHAGCRGPSYMMRCGGCVQIAAMMCGPGTMAVEVPECKEAGYGDCVPK